MIPLASEVTHAHASSVHSAAADGTAVRTVVVGDPSVADVRQDRDLNGGPAAARGMTADIKVAIWERRAVRN